MWWKLYTWLLLTILLVAYTMILADTPTVVDVLDIPISLVAWSGLCAFAHRKKLGAARIWRVWFFVIVLWDIACSVVFDFSLGVRETVEDGEPTMAPYTLIACIFLVPQYVALYVYGHKRATIWNALDT